MYLEFKHTLEVLMAPHFSTLAWKIPWMEEPGRLLSIGLLGSDTTERLHFHFSLSCIGEGNGNPLQCSCLENPRDGGAWWAAICGVTQSRTRLKWLSSRSIDTMSFVSHCYLTCIQGNNRRGQRRHLCESDIWTECWIVTRVSLMEIFEKIMPGVGWGKVKMRSNL